MFNWAAVITRDVAQRKLAGASVEMVVVHPDVLTFLVHAYHDGVLYCVGRDPDAAWMIDGVPLIEDRRVQSYEIK
jgi:hypothetical protein